MAVARLLDAPGHHFNVASGSGHFGSRLQTNARIEISGAASGGGATGCGGGGGGEGCGGRATGGAGGELIGRMRSVDSNAGFSRSTAAEVGKDVRATAGAAMAVAICVAAAGANAARVTGAAAAALGTAARSITVGRLTAGAGGTFKATGAAATTGFRADALLPVGG